MHFPQFYLAATVEREMPEHPGARGHLQLVEICDAEGNVLEDLIPVGVHFTSEDALRAAIRKEIIARLVVEIEYTA